MRKKSEWQSIIENYDITALFNEVLYSPFLSFSSKHTVDSLDVELTIAMTDGTLLVNASFTPCIPGLRFEELMDYMSYPALNIKHRFKELHNRGEIELTEFHIEFSTHLPTGKISDEEYQYLESI